MSGAVLLVIIVVATIQSLFGVGVLLFGTPLLLILGHSFVGALLILLPISLAINLLQIIRHRAHIDFRFYKKILIYAVPGVVIFLFLVTHARINMGLLIGPFLLIVALKNFSPNIAALLDSLVRYERSYFVSMGVVHGLTNLGGSLLTAVIHTKNYPRDVARVTTAVSYATFAAFQIATLTLSHEHGDIPYSRNAGYLLAGVLMFFLTEKFVYAKIDNDRYRLIFAFFLAASGALLIGKALLAH
ncbi:MAG TPA: TSUP family transporter [Anaerolineales bacterium]|nr:TSUP family transporter [Anaerolineales bacterium]